MTEIKLNFNRKDFEEFYFRNGTEKIFFYPKLKGHTYLTFISGFICFSSFIYSCITNDYWGLFILLFIIWCLFIFELGKRIKVILNWRKAVTDFIDKNEKYKSHIIILTENTFVIVQDDKETMERWSEFKRAEIDNIAIALWGNNSYLLPRKAMTDEEYELLKKEIGEKIKNVVPARQGL